MPASVNPQRGEVRPPASVRPACASFLAMAMAMAAVLLAAAGAAAEMLPIRTFGVADGLAHNRVTSIHQDGKGYLWICTWEGLSRFDGTEFVNYGTGDGIPNALVNDMDVDSAGRLWIATHGGGVARLEEKRRDASGPGFIAYRVDTLRESNVVFGIHGAPDGSLWCPTEAGLYHASVDTSGTPRFEAVPLPGGEFLTAFPLISNTRETDARETDAREIIALTRERLFRIGPADTESWPLPEPVPRERFSAAAADRDGRVLLSVDERLYQFSPPGTWVRIALPLTLDQYITSLFRDSSGVLWVGTRAGLWRVASADTTRYMRSHGLSDDWIRGVYEDRDGNLWIATQLGGLDRFPRRGIVSFGFTEGLRDPNVTRFVEAHDGRLYASTGRGGVAEVRDREIHQVPGSEAPPFNRIFVHILQDRRGDWWVAPDVGLYRFEGPDLQLRRGKKFGAPDGIPADIRVFGTIREDHAGRIWLCGFDSKIYVFDPAAAPPRFNVLDIGSADFNSPVRDFLHQGDRVWMMPFVGLWYLEREQLVRFQPGEGFPDPDQNTRVLHVDSRGWLWIGLRFHGVCVTREPLAERPPFRTYSTDNGLASNAVWAITEDPEGRMYFGTARGVDRLDVESEAVRHFTSFDGLAGDIVNDLHRDSRGFIWAGTSGGISRIPSAEPPAESAPPPIFIQRLEAGGEDVAMPETGTTSLGAIELPASRNNVLIAFAGLEFQGPGLQYQWMLEGADRDWSRPMSMRSVQYARLSPGQYRFLVRAITADGVTSREPAVVTFRVRPPFWREPWFVGALSVAALALAYLLHRARVRRVLALERIRRQIATDLHDDIGSGLSQIAVLSEVGKQRADSSLSDHLDEMANLARAMRDSMSDIVWSVDPRKDHLSDLIQRMRQVALNLLEAAGVEVDFRAPPEAEFQRVNLAPDRRRHLYLISKEAITNVARHAAASRVIVAIALHDRKLELTLEDDGVGYGDTVREGHGLASMRQRARELGGELVVTSAPGRGTRMQLSVPLR